MWKSSNISIVQTLESKVLRALAGTPMRTSELYSFMKKYINSHTIKNGSLSSTTKFVNNLVPAVYPTRKRENGQKIWIINLELKFVIVKVFNISRFIIYHLKLKLTYSFFFLLQALDPRPVEFSSQLVHSCGGVLHKCGVKLYLQLLSTRPDKISVFVCIKRQKRVQKVECSWHWNLSNSRFD